MPDYEEAARRVKRLMAGKDYREEGERMGLHFTTLYDLAKGRKKSRETVIRFARHFREPVNDWLALYDHEPEEEPSFTEALENAVQIGRRNLACELQYASEEEAGPILQFTGQTDIPDHDRALLEEAYRIMEAEHRAKHGPQD
jgi:hypothetical protein